MNEEALGWAGRLMRWLDFAVNLVLINLLFVAGVLAGGVVAGLFPSAVAASTMLARLRTGTLGEHPTGISSRPIAPSFFTPTRWAASSGLQPPSLC